jgi:hypothetical protein
MTTASSDALEAMNRIAQNASTQSPLRRSYIAHLPTCLRAKRARAMRIKGAQLSLYAQPQCYPPIIDEIAIPSPPPSFFARNLSVHNDSVRTRLGRPTFGLYR